MKDLRPTIRTKGLKTGKNREFLQKTVFLAIFTQPTIEHARRFSVFLPYSTQKFPTKITGKFLEHIRELSANNRELYFKPQPPETNQNIPTYPTLTLRYVCDSLYLTKELAMAEIKKIFNEYDLDFDNNKYGLGQSS